MNTEELDYHAFMAESVSDRELFVAWCDDQDLDWDDPNSDLAYEDYLNDLAYLNEVTR